MGKYFNTDESFGRHSYSTLRIECSSDDGSDDNGWSIMKGGMINPKGKLIQANVIAHTDTKAEAEELVHKLCAL